MQMIARNIRYFQRLWQLRKARSLRLPLLLAAAFIATLAPLSAQAGLQEYTILALGVSRSSETASALALDYARKRALYLAVRKLGLTDPGAVAAKISEADMAHIIRGATVLKTRRDGEKTYAQVSVSIADDILRKTLNVAPADEQAQAAATTIRNVLILPALVLPDKTFIWQKDSPLRPPLSSALLQQGHGLVILPGGDLADLRLIDEENIATVMPEELTPMFTRYGADEIVIAIITPGADTSPDATAIKLRRLSATGVRNETLGLIPESADATITNRIAQAAQALAGVAIEIATSSADDERAKLANAKQIHVQFIYTIPSELARMQDLVRNAPGVLQLALPTIGLNHITGTIYLDGDKTALHHYLSKKAVVIREKEGTWMISTR